MTNPASITRLGVEALTEGDPSAELQRLGAEVQSAGNAAAELQRLGVEVMSPQTQNAVIKRLGVEVMSSVVTQPQVSHILTYLAEIECYHPDDAYSDNRLFWSEDLTASAWEPFLTAPAIAANATNDPNGVLTADQITLTTAGTLKQGLTVEPITDYVLSFYIKLGTATNSLYAGVYDPVAAFWMTGYLEPGDTEWSAVNSSTWTRLEIPFNTTDQRYVEVLLPWHNAAQAGNTLYVWGVQVEAATTMGAYQKTEGATTRTLRFSSLPYTSQADDTPAHTHYESRLLQPGLMRRDLFSPGQPGGPISVGYGLVEILNTGDLDDYAEASFDGRSYVLKVGRLDEALADFTTVLRTTMEAADFTLNRLTIKLRDQLAELDNPITKLKYRGDGSSVEGDADLKDRYKPLVFGSVMNVTPVLVNEALLIYQASSGPVSSLIIYEGGLQVSVQAAYTSQADMVANAPSSGYARVWPDGGLFRLGFTPSMLITCNAVSDDDAFYTGTCLQVMAQAGGWTGTVNAADVSALNLVMSPASVGYFVENGAPALEAMNAIAAGIGVWFGPDRLGELRMGVLTEPGGTPDLSLTATDIIQLERQTAPIPAKQVTLKYKRNWTLMQEFDGSVAEAQRQLLRENYTQLVALNTANVNSRKLAVTLAYESAIRSDTGADVTLWRLMDLYGTPRAIYTAVVRARVADTLLLDLNDVVQVTYPRFGMDTGKLFRIIGIQADYRIGQLELTLWG
jgi:hypothetical protein